MAFWESQDSDSAMRECRICVHNKQSSDQPPGIAHGRLEICPVLSIFVLSAIKLSSVPRLCGICLFTLKVSKRSVLIDH